MTFNEIEEGVKLLNSIDYKKCGKEYHILFWEMYHTLVKMDETGEIIKEPDRKNISYLLELLEHDGPEYAYTIEFWHRDSEEKRYRIGVCVRGEPILKKV